MNAARSPEDQPQPGHAGGVASEPGLPGRLPQSAPASAGPDNSGPASPTPPDRGRSAARLPLRRPQAGRLLGGVCAAMAAHLEFPVKLVRIAMVVLAVMGGLGLFLYLFWWLTIPQGDPGQAARGQVPPAYARLAPRLQASIQSWDMAALLRKDVLLGLALLVIAVMLVVVRLNPHSQQSWILPAVLAVTGLGLAWSQLDQVKQGQQVGGRWQRPAMWRLGGGLLLVMAGVLVFMGFEEPSGQVVQTALAAFAVVIGFALVLAPWWARLLRTLGDERAARAREAERADIAAHLHDSVLQTLSLIRAQAGDADAVTRMARAQERELREYLYADRPVPGTSLVAELRALVAQVEDGPVGRLALSSIEVVTVGDCAPQESTTVVLQACREALINAVVHGSPPVSLYCEVAGDKVQVFIKDRGAGFDMAAIAPDRLGVRESIVGRMRRAGGSAQVVTRPGWGTEVRLTMPLTIRDA